MTISEAISNADVLRPNVIPEEMKARALLTLESDVASLMGVPAPGNNWPHEQELLMPAPHDIIYELYLAVVIDHYNQDTKLYDTDQSIANDARDAAFGWWRRNHVPEVTAGWRVM